MQTWAVLLKRRSLLRRQARALQDSQQQRWKRFFVSRCRVRCSPKSSRTQARAGNSFKVQAASVVSRDCVRSAGCGNCHNGAMATCTSNSSLRQTKCWNARHSSRRTRSRA